jgi:predicted RNA-binding protein with PIN domain
VPWLVDGDNLLGTWPGRRRTSAERRRLAHELARHARATGKRIVVVFDGADDNLAGLADVRCSGTGRTADDVILEIVRGEQDRAGWTVVTCDRPLGDRARWLGARTERSDLFRKRLDAGGDAEKPDHEHNVRDWLAEFGEE